MKGLSAVLLLPVGFFIGCAKPVGEPASQAALPGLPVEVEQVARQRGQAIASETFNLLSSNLLAALQSGGVSNALPFCSLAASPLTAGIAEKHGVTLRRISDKPRNPQARADEAERLVLKSFEAQLASNINPPPPIVTNLKAGHASFFAPIIMNRMCLQCHGSLGQDIRAENHAIIQRLYPEDQATGFAVGQLRGMWRIDFPIASLNPPG